MFIQVLLVYYCCKLCYAPDAVILSRAPDHDLYIHVFLHSIVIGIQAAKIIITTKKC